MEEKSTRGRFTKELKIESVGFVKQRAEKSTEIAENLGIHTVALVCWIR